MWAYSLVLTVVLAVHSLGQGSPKKSSFFYSGGRFGGPLGPQQNYDGLWTFVAVPIPLENQTVPAGDFPQEQVAQAKLWGPIYRPGHGWVYGEAGFILVPRMPPYVPPTIIPPPRSQPPPPTTGSVTSQVGQVDQAVPVPPQVQNSIDP